MANTALAILFMCYCDTLVHPDVYHNAATIPIFDEGMVELEGHRECD